MVDKYSNKARTEKQGYSLRSKRPATRFYRSGASGCKCSGDNSFWSQFAIIIISIVAFIIALYVYHEITMSPGDRMDEELYRMYQQVNVDFEHQNPGYQEAATNGDLANYYHNKYNYQNTTAVVPAQSTTQMVRIGNVALMEKMPAKEIYLKVY